MAAKSALNLCDCFFFLLVETLSEFDCDCFSLCFCRNVNTYIYIYKSCGYVNTYIYLVIFVSLGLRPQVLDIHVTTGGRPSAKPKNTKTTCLLRQNYRDFFFDALASKVGPVSNKFKKDSKSAQKNSFFRS